MNGWPLATSLHRALYQTQPQLRKTLNCAKIFNDNKFSVFIDTWDTSSSYQPDFHQIIFKILSALHRRLKTPEASFKVCKPGRVNKIQIHSQMLVQGNSVRIRGRHSFRQVRLVLLAHKNQVHWFFPYYGHATLWVFTKWTQSFFRHSIFSGQGIGGRGIQNVITFSKKFIRTFIIRYIHFMSKRLDPVIFYSKNIVTVSNVWHTFWFP